MGRFNENEIEDYRSNGAYSQNRVSAAKRQLSTKSISALGGASTAAAAAEYEQPLSKTMPINFKEGQRGHISMLRYLLGAPIVNQADRAVKASEQKKNSATIAAIMNAKSTSSAVTPGRFAKNFSPDEVDDNRSDLSRRVTLT